MNFKFHFSPVSRNAKTGPIPVTTTEKASCPATCPFIEHGCYAKGGPLNIHWNRVGIDRFIHMDELFTLIKRLPFKQIWRHNQAGDLPHVDGQILPTFIDGIIKANTGKRGFTYTHHRLTPKNFKLIKKCNDNGFTVNASTEKLAAAVKSFKKGLPTVCVVPSTQDKHNFEHDGVKFLQCPATYRDNMNCNRCGLCAKADRNCVVTFPSHGAEKKMVDKIIK